MTKQCAILALALSLPQGADSAPCPDDLSWLKKECGDGALAYTADGKISMVEISTGRTERIGNGNQPEFSPDGSKLAWIDGRTARGCMRKGDRTIHVIAENIEPKAGVHWLGNDEVLVVLAKPKGWHRVSLSGRAVPVPELTRLGVGDKECDVRLGEDGVWSYVAGRTWKTSDGQKGPIGGGCSCSLSQDGRAITALQGGHKECKLNRIRPGGYAGELRWKYDGSFDNHRWSSNDDRFFVCVEEKSNRMAILHRDSDRATLIGEKGRSKGEMYGDFTVGPGRGSPWPSAGKFEVVEETAPVQPERRTGPVELSGAWPGSSDGLVFLWENGKSPNEVPDESGKTVEACGGRLSGAATIGRHYELELAGGAFHAEDDSNARLLSACRRTGQLSVEVVIRAGNLQQEGPARIVTFSSGTSSRNFTLGQEKDRLVFRLKTTDSKGGNGTEVDLGRIEAGRTYHVLVSYRSGRLAGFVNGVETFSTNELGGDFSNWSAQRLCFGDEIGGGRDWSGWLEAVAIYNRSIELEEAKGHLGLVVPRFKERRDVPQAVVDVRLSRVCPIPDPDDIAPYTRCLAEWVYDVEKVVEGRCDATRIAVNRWVILDEKKLPADAALGKRYRLIVEEMAANPQLANERRVSALKDTEFDVPAFYEPRAEQVVK